MLRKDSALNVRAPTGGKVYNKRKGFALIERGFFGCETKRPSSQQNKDG
jgi:hypothetical protein